MMNERIQKLAKQCYETGPIGKDGWPEYSQLNETRFAELIVRECAQACINMGNDYEIKSAGQYQAELFAFAIKQHFGVEE